MLAAVPGEKVEALVPAGLVEREPKLDLVQLAQLDPDALVSRQPVEKPDGLRGAAAAGTEPPATPEKGVRTASARATDEHLGEPGAYAGPVA
jgi:hypothetical protein